MTVTEVRRKPDTYFAWQFDGTQESVDLLQIELDGTDINAGIEFVSPTEYRRWNPPFPRPGDANNSPDEILVFCRSSTGASVIMEGDYSPDLFAQQWEQV
jgi:hypothetical protein